MKTLVLSDIHLGSPLVNKKLEIVKLLKSNEFDTIILNGDIFDIWEESFEGILSDNPYIVKTLKHKSKIKDIYWVIGNHDPNIDEILKIFPDIKVVHKLKMDNILIIHGDQFDNLVTKYSWIAKILYIPHWICQRIFHINIKSFSRNLFNSISNKKNKTYFNQLVGDIEKESIKYYKNQCRYLVMGHTHVPKIVEYKECDYINFGDIIHSGTYGIIEHNKSFTIKKI